MNSPTSGDELHTHIKLLISRLGRAKRVARNGSSKLTEDDKYPQEAVSDAFKKLGNIAGSRIIAGEPRIDGREQDSSCHSC